MPVTAEEAARHCRQLVGDDDQMFDDLIADAVGHIEGPQGVLNRCLLSQTWQAGVARWLPQLRLPFPDVQSVTLSYVDAFGAAQAVDPGAFNLTNDALGGLVSFRGDWSAPVVDHFRSEPITVEIVAGFGPDPDDLPRAIRQAILQIVGHWYNNREAATDRSLVEMPLSAQNLLARWRHLVL